MRERQRVVKGQVDDLNAAAHEAAGRCDLRAAADLYGRAERLDAEWGITAPVTKAVAPPADPNAEADFAVLFSALESVRSYIADAPQDVQDAFELLHRYVEELFPVEELPAAGPAELPKSSRLAPLLRDLRKVTANPGGRGTAAEVFRTAASAVPDPMRDSQPGVPNTFEDAVVQAYVNRHRGAHGTPHPNLARRVAPQTPQAARQARGASFEDVFTDAARRARKEIT